MTPVLPAHRGKRVRTLFMAMCWMISMTVAFLVGRQGRTGTPAVAASPPADQAPMEIEVPRKDSREAGRKAFPREPPSTSDVSAVDVEESQETSEQLGEDLMIPVRRLPPEELDRYLRSGLASDDRTFRALVIAQVLYQLNAENARALYPTFQRMSQERKVNYEAFDQFLLHWAKVDGSSAMAAYQSQDNAHGSLVNKMITSWAEGDPQSCLAHLTEQGLDEDKLLLYLRGAAARDPVIFEDFLANMEDKALQKTAVRRVAYTLGEKNGAMFEWAERAIKMPNPDPSYVKQVLHEFYQYNFRGRAMADWIERNADSPWLSLDAPKIAGGLTGEDFFAQAAGRWAISDGPAALEWIARNGSDPRMTKKAFDEVMRVWNHYDAPGNIEWIRRNLGDPRVTSTHVGRAVSAWAKTEPKAAAGWVERNVDRKSLESVAQQVVAPWVSQAPEEAMDWIATLPEDKQRQPYYQAARKWPQDRLDELATWLAGAGSDARFDSARSKVALRYVDIDIQTALDFANTIVDPKPDDIGLIWFGEALIQKDPEAARAWLPTSGLSEKAKARIMSKAAPPDSER